MQPCFNINFTIDCSRFCPRTLKLRLCGCCSANTEDVTPAVKTQEVAKTALAVKDPEPIKRSEAQLDLMNPVITIPNPKKKEKSCFSLFKEMLNK